MKLSAGSDSIFYCVILCKPLESIAPLALALLARSIMKESLPCVANTEV